MPSLFLCSWVPHPRQDKQLLAMTYPVLCSEIHSNLWGKHVHHIQEAAGDGGSKRCGADPTVIQRVFLIQFQGHLVSHSNNK